MALTRPAAEDLAARLFGSSPARRLALLRAAWPLAAGSELARRTEVVAVEGATLRVRVADASWRKELLRVRGPLIGRLRRVAGALSPSRLAFCEGPISTPRESKAEPLGQGPAPPPSAALQAAAASIEDDAVRARFLDSANRYLARARSRRSPT
jgi:hypothetical protein